MQDSDIGTHHELPSKWHQAFYTLWFGCFITGMGYSMTMPFISLFIDELGHFSRFQLNIYSGLAFAATFISQAIVSPYWGSLADRKGRKLMCMRASGVMACTIFLTGLSVNVWMIIGLRFLQGAFSGYINNSIALMAGETPHSKSGWVMSAMTTAGVTGNLIGPLLGGTLSGAWGYRVPFFITGGLMLGVFIATSLLVKEKFTPIKKENMKPMRELLGQIDNVQLIVVMFITTMLVQSSVMSINPIVSLYVREMMHDSGNIAFVAGIVAATPGLGLVAAGVRPEISLAKEAGLECDRTITVNEFMQTSDPDIYAGGDCVSVTHRISGEKIYGPMGSTANKHGRIIGTNIAKGNVQTFPGVLGTSICKMFDWSIGKVGLTEADAKRLGYDVVTCVVPGPDITHFIPGKKLIMVKTVADKKTARILGVQIVGPGNVDKRIDTMAGALSANPQLTAYDMGNMDLAYAPPFSSAVDNLLVNANVIQNELEGRAHSYDFFESLEKLQDENVVFVDLRVDDEVKAMPFETPNYHHIPIEELRARMDELPRDKEIIVFCILCTRGYEAQLILEQNGFTNVHFIKGGIMFWPFKKYLNK